MFPSNNHHDLNVRSREKYRVTFAHTENYRNSAVPCCQRLLNDDNKAREAAASARSVEAKGRDCGSSQEEGGGRITYIYTTVNVYLSLKVYHSSFNNKKNHTN